MTNYKFVINIIYSVLLTIIVVFFVVNIFIDPYGEYNIVQKKWNYFKKVASHETSTFKLFRLLKENKYNIVFGTSHSGYMSSEMFGSNTLNFSNSLYGNPVDVYHFLQQLDINQIKNIKNVYYLLDAHTFLDKNSIFNELDLNSWNDFYIATFQNIGKKKILVALGTVKANLNGSIYRYLARTGEIVDKNQTTIEEISIEKTRMPTYGKKAIDFLKKVNLFFLENNIHVIYYTSPLNIPYLKKIDCIAYEKQFASFFTSIEKVYDFRYLPQISEQLSNYTDHDHLSVKATKKFVEILKKEPNQYQVKFNSYKDIIRRTCL